MKGGNNMIKLNNVNDAKKGDKVFVKEISPMWDSKKEETYNHCFEYVFEVIRNNPKTFGCKHINGPYAGSGFNWIKNQNLENSKKEYFLIENETEVIENNYRL